MEDRRKEARRKEDRRHIKGDRRKCVAARVVFQVLKEAGRPVGIDEFYQRALSLIPEEVKTSWHADGVDPVKGPLWRLQADGLIELVRPGWKFCVHERKVV